MCHISAINNQQCGDNVLDGGDDVRKAVGCIIVSAAGVRMCRCVDM